MLLLINLRNIIAKSLLVAEIFIAKHGPKSIVFHTFVNFDVSSRLKGLRYRAQISQAYAELGVHRETQCRLAKQAARLCKLCPFDRKITAMHNTNLCKFDLDCTS